MTPMDDMDFVVVFGDNTTEMLVEFGETLQIAVGNVEIDVEETAEGVLIRAKDAEGEEAALVRHGKDGKDGQPGERGETGPAGPQGERGLQGIQGVPGERGPAGADGKPGRDGYTPERGKDYYTDADKADMVAAVIEEIPTASSSAYGLVRTGTSANGEMHMGNTNGRAILRYPVAGSTGLKQRKSQGSQYGGLVDCSNFDTAVKTAMTDGAGAAWTEAEQAAARQRLGAVSLDEVLAALPVYAGEVADA